MIGSVIAAFPATGKTHYARGKMSVIDSDSSSFKGDDWPWAYVEDIRFYFQRGATVLVSTHEELRNALVDGGVPFTLVYPSPDQREEYRERMRRRASPPALIARVIDDIWDDALASCRAQTGCEHIVLRPGEYLLDALTKKGTR